VRRERSSRLASYPGRALCGHAGPSLFNPDKWNAILVDLLRTTTGYNYADVPKDRYVSRNRGIGGAGHPAAIARLPDLTAAVKADGLQPSDCDAPSRKRCWKVASSSIRVPATTADFHWYRQDDDGHMVP